MGDLDVHAAVLAHVDGFRDRLVRHVRSSRMCEE
jgi:hypothetical protein